MIQQMFGRAGRAGKEPEGWAFLLVAANELGRWRQRLGQGYSINSGILNSVADHLLGEVIQGNIGSQEQAETWWESTLAYHQGEQNRTPINDARDFLVPWRFVETQETKNGLLWSATRLGAGVVRVGHGVCQPVVVRAVDAIGLCARRGRHRRPKSAW